VKAHHPFIQYFADIYDGITTTFKGMRLTLTYFFKPKVTMQYPEERPVVPEGHRGKHIYVEEKCTLCKACAAACPVDCIAIDSVGRGKDGLVTQFDIDYSKCLFCDLCCEACNSDCLFLGKDYDMAAAERAGCVLHFARTKSPEVIKAFQEMLAKKEAAKKAQAAAATPPQEGK
jgi:NADH-quinone oxidoreductase subunit I